MSSDRPLEEPDPAPEAAPARGLHLRQGDLPLEPEQFLLLPRFRLLPNNYRKGIEVRCKGAFALRLFRAGDTICRKGDPGNSAFYLLGDADLFALYRALATLLAKKESDKGPNRLKEPTAETLRRRIGDYQSIPLLAANRVPPLEESAKADDEIAARCEKSKDPDDQARLREWLSLNRDDRLAVAANLTADQSESAELLRRSAAAQPEGALARVDGVEPPPLMRERELIGEMALYNRQPRQATV